MNKKILTLLISGLFLVVVVFVLAVKENPQSLCLKVSAADTIPNPDIPKVQDSQGTGGKMDQISKSVEERGIVPCKLSECTFCYLLLMVERIFFWLLSIAFIFAVLIVIVAGLLYITAMGSSGMMSAAKDALKYAIVGFIICLLSWLAIHVFYILLGYKGKDNSNWWQMNCETSSESASEVPNISITKTSLAEEVDSANPGGRNNPFALSDLSLEKLASIPDNKYFFIHGIGGQPLDQASAELEKVVSESEGSGKVVYAAVPYQDQNGNVVGSRLINLNNYLSSDKQGGSLGTSLSNQQVDNFSNLALFILSQSASHEIPLISTPKNTEPISFSGIWPETDWYANSGSQSSPSFNPSSSVSEGMHYQEGTGPYFYDPARYDNQISDDQTHVDVNVNEDGSLNLKNPVTVENVAKGVSSEKLNNYLTQLINVLFKVQNQYEVQGKKGDFIDGLNNLLTQSISDKLGKISGGYSSQENNIDQSGIAEEIAKISQNKLSNSGMSNNLNTNTGASTTETANTDTPTTDAVLNTGLSQNSWVTGGTGILPDKIQTNGTNNQPSNSDIINMIKNILKNQNSGSSGGGGNGNNSGNGNTGNSGSSGNTGNSGTSNNNSSGDWSDTSLNVKGYTLSPEEKTRLESMIEKDLKMVNLDVPPEFVMCIIQRESNFNPEAHNNRGEDSVGLMQINKRSGTDKVSLNALKKYSPELYQDLLKQHGSDSKIIDYASMKSRNDPQGEKGKTIIALGIAYLKDNNMRGRGDGLGSPSNWDNLAASYNCGAAGCKGGRTDYSNNVTACTRTMLKKDGKNPDTGK